MLGRDGRADGRMRGGRDHVILIYAAIAYLGILVLTLGSMPLIWGSWCWWKLNVEIRMAGRGSEIERG